MPCHLGADAKDAEAVASVPPVIYGLPLSAFPEAASLRGSWTGGSVLVCRHTSMTRTMREWSHAPQLSAAAFGARSGPLEAQPLRRKVSASAAATAKKKVVQTEVSCFIRWRLVKQETSHHPSPSPAALSRAFLR